MLSPVGLRPAWHLDSRIGWCDHPNPRVLLRCGELLAGDGDSSVGLTLDSQFVGEHKPRPGESEQNSAHARALLSDGSIEMNVYISVDLEGIAGVATIDQTVRNGRGYPHARALMTAETNAAAAGAFGGGADSVTVSDSHGTMDNLLLDELDSRICLVTGAPRQDGMMEGITSDHDVAFFVGYHAGAETPGVLAHTFSPHFLAIRLNDVVVSEAEVNALQAAAVGVPVGLLTGDDCTCNVIAQRLPQIQTVTVKTARGFSTATSLSSAEACRRICEAASDVVRHAAMLETPEVPVPLVIEIDLPHAIAAERGSLLTGVERTGDRTVSATFAHPKEAIAFVMTCSQLAAAAMRARLPLISQ